MSSDLIISDSVVVGLQGVAVSDETPTDGYVLTYSSSDDGYWAPKPVVSSGLRKEYFTNDGYWTCPENVTSILLIGAGGGGGGGGGGRNTHGGVQQPTQGQGGAGGGGSIQSSISLSVIPGLIYNIIIGEGGLGGDGAQNGASFDNGVAGLNGGNTEFKYENDILASFTGAGPGAGGSYIVDTRLASIGGPNIATAYLYSENRLNLPAGYGGTCTSSSFSLPGQNNYIGNYIPGVSGSGSSTYVPGAGGGAGPQGNGGNGGDGGSTPTNGQSAGDNTGAGGGGGGGGGTLGMGVEAGDGGAGGSGYLYIIF